jgi:hypothetical protein
VDVLKQFKRFSSLTRADPRLRLLHGAHTSDHHRGSGREPILAQFLRLIYVLLVSYTQLSPGVEAPE